MKRSKGTLHIQADPPAPLITITGPEFSTTLHDTQDTNIIVPTDQYDVQAEYSHWSQTQRATVTANLTVPFMFAPKLGTLNLTCNRAGATFSLTTEDNQLIDDGDLPKLSVGLVAGNYLLTAIHHQHQSANESRLKRVQPTKCRLRSHMARQTVNSTQAGANVLDGSGNLLGTTPLELSELMPGELQITIQLPGYESILVSHEIAADKTVTFAANLVKTSYKGAMVSARCIYGRVGDVDRAFPAAGDALIDAPSDTEAVAVQNEATGKQHLRKGKLLAKSGDFIGADKEVELALQSLPDNDEAKQLMADCKKHEPEQIEHLRLERAERGQKTFDAATSRMADAGLFETHEIKTMMPATRAILQQSRRP